VIRCLLYRNGEVEAENFDPTLVSDYLDQGDTLVWLDVEDPTEDDLKLLEEEFSLPAPAMDDVRARSQRSSVEVYERCFFVVLNALAWRGGEIEVGEIHAFVAPNYLITLRYPPAFDLSGVRRRWAAEGAQAAEGGGFLLHALVDEVVDEYFDVIDQLELASERVEDEIFADRPPDDVQERLFRVKKKVLEARRQIMPLREVLDLLGEEPRIVTERLQAYYRDVADHLIRALEFVDNLRELLTTALDAHLSLVSYRLNDVMKKLTSWAAIILIPTMIAGIYGMNFRYMPELTWRYGYFIVLGVMILAAGALYVTFKKRDWL
jgi:magnesium transporter